jgi:ABC-2 type transport system ATP-binding protein
MATWTLEAQSLTKRFGARTALHDLSLTAAKGDIVGLLGPNGAGKTTAIRVLTTMLEPTSGQFSVAGTPSGRPNEIRRLIGVLPEGAGYPAHQTARDYLCFYARLFGMTRAAAEHTAERLLAEVDLTERASSPIRTFSRGMRQRLGIARALVNEPAVVFLDEPTLGLDPAGQQKVLAILRDIALLRGATVLLSTHTLTEVEQVCTKVVILNKGDVVTSGSVAEVTRAAAVRRSGRIRVPAELVERAKQAISAVPGLTVEPASQRSDVIVVTAEAGPDAGPDATPALLNAALVAVARADVPVLSFEVAGGHLSDAFFALTTASAQ